MLRRLVLSAIAVVAVAATPAWTQDSPPNTLTQGESQQGWLLLFNGTSLNGWESRPTGRNRENQKPGQPDWAVENGALVCGGTVPSWIGTTASFSNYVLKLEFRGPARVNSGVFLRSQKEGAPHRTGYELQIWDYQPAGYNTGSLVGLVTVPPTKIIPDQWNRYEITADRNHLVAVLNGNTVLDVRDSTHASGVVGLQCQRDNRIEFRNIKVLPRQ
jgi:hypothetical protein